MTAITDEPLIRPVAGRRIRSAALLPVGWIQVVGAEYLVSGSWRGRYDPRTNYLSELGVKYCRDGACNISWVLMNISFVAAGLSLLGMGVAMAWRRWSMIGGVLFACAGVTGGSIGIIRTDTAPALHENLANVFFLCASLAVLATVAERRRSLPRAVVVAAALLSAVSLVALLAYIGGGFPQVGPGTTERLILYPALTAAAGVWWFSPFASVREGVRS